MGVLKNTRLRAGDRRRKKGVKMKIWILAIFRLSAETEKQISALEAKIENIAINPFGVTVKQYRRVLELSDMRRRMCNLNIMYNLLISELNEEEVFLIAKYAYGLSANEIAAYTGLKPGATYKRINKALNKAEKILKNAGYDYERMEKEYGEFPSVKSVLAILKSKARKSDEKKLKEA